MKRWFCLLLALLCAAVLAACERQSPLESPKSQSVDGVSLDLERSFFSDFRVDGPLVCYGCHLELVNDSEEVRTVTLLGLAPSDVKTGLLRDEVMTCHAPDEQGEIADEPTVFVLEPGRNALDVVLVGAHGTSDAKADRLLPEILIKPASIG